MIKNGGLQNLSTTQSVCQWRVTTGSQHDFGDPYVDGAGPLVQAARQGDGSYMPTNLTTSAAPAECKVLLSSATNAWGIVVHSGGVTDPGLVDMFDINTVHAVAGVPKVVDAVASSTAIFNRGHRHHRQRRHRTRRHAVDDGDDGAARRRVLPDGNLGVEGRRPRVRRAA